MPRQILKCDMVQEFPSREYSSLEQEHSMILFSYPLEFDEFVIRQHLLSEIQEKQNQKIIAIRRNCSEYELIFYGKGEVGNMNLGFWSNVLQLGKIVVCADDITQKLYFSRDSFFKEFNETERLKAE